MAKIEVNALKNSKGDVFSLGIWGIIIGFIGGIIGYPKFELIEETGWLIVSCSAKFIGAFLIYLLFNYFSKACEGLGKALQNKLYCFTYFFILCVILAILRSFVDHKVLTVIGGLFAIADIILLLIIGTQLKKNYSGLLGKIGDRMTRLFLATAIYIVVYIVFPYIIAGLIHDHSYSTAKSVNTLFAIAKIGLSLWILVINIRLFMAISTLMENGYNRWLTSEYDDYELYLTGGNQAVNTSNLEQDNSTTFTSWNDTFSKKTPFKSFLPVLKKKKFIWSIIGICAITGIVFLILGVSGVFKNPYDKYFAAINIEEISPGSLAKEGEKNYVGLRITKNNYNNLLDLEYYNIEMRWEPSSDDPSVLEVSVIFKNIYEVYDDICGIGYLKGDKLEIYSGVCLWFNDQNDRDELRECDMLMYYHDKGFAIGRLSLGHPTPLLKAKVKNLASFEASFYESYTGQESNIQLYDENTWDQLRLETKVCVFSNYESDHVVSIQLIRPYTSDNFGAKAIVLGSLFYEERDFYTVINSENQFSLGEGEPMPFLGIATWEGDKLKVDDMEGGFFYMDMSDGESF